LGGHQHPALWTLLGALQQDETMAATTIVQHARGQPLTERQKRCTMQQQRLYNLCCSCRDSTKSAIDTLHALGHCIQLQ